MTTRAMKWALVAVSALALAGIGCGGDDESDNNDKPDSGAGSGGSGGGAGSAGDDPDGGAGTSGAGGAGTSGASGAAGAPVPEPVVCGETTCAGAAGGAMFGIMDCCLENDECGIMSTIASGECLPMNAPGGIDLSCPEYESGLGGAWSGCCTPDGECGALSAGIMGMAGLGCVSNALLGSPEQSCDYDPNNTCTRFLEVRCDGAEDCGDGEMCCGKFDGGYRQTSCMEASLCSELDAVEGGMWFQICHEGEACADETRMCKQNTMYLPDFLARCPGTMDTGEEPVNATENDEGEINCGESVCEPGQKCCVSVPGLPACVDEDEDCKCTPEDADGGDAG